LSYEVLDVDGADEGQIALLLGAVHGQLDLRCRSIPDADLEPVGCHVQGEILAHHGQTV